VSINKFWIMANISIDRLSNLIFEKINIIKGIVNKELILQLGKYTDNYRKV